MPRSTIGSIVYPLTFMVLGLSSANADTGRWRTNGEAATLLSNNTLSTGNRSIEYHPVLTITCRGGWAKSVRLREVLSGRGTINVSVRLDGSQDSETWRLANRNAGFSLAGEEGVVRLLRAKRFRLAWSNGFFSGTGEAVFSLAGITDVVKQLAAACGVDPPR